MEWVDAIPEREGDCCFAMGGCRGLWIRVDMIPGMTNFDLVGRINTVLHDIGYVAEYRVEGKKWWDLKVQRNTLFTFGLKKKE